MIKIFIVDDHQVFREGLCVLIDSAEDMEMVGEADSGEDAFAKLQHVLPDLILMDVQMPVENGIDVTVRVKAQYPDVKILMVTMFEEPHSVQAAMQAGACGYILKGSNHREMLHAIRMAADGEILFTTPSTEM